MHHIISMIKKEMKTAGISPEQLVRNLPNRRSFCTKRIAKNIHAILGETERPYYDDIVALIYAAKRMRIDDFLESVLADKESTNKALKFTLVLCEEKLINVYAILPSFAGSHLYSAIFMEMQLLTLAINRLKSIVDDQRADLPES